MFICLYACEFSSFFFILSLFHRYLVLFKTRAKNNWVHSKFLWIFCPPRNCKNSCNTSMYTYSTVWCSHKSVLFFVCFSFFVVMFYALAQFWILSCFYYVRDNVRFIYLSAGQMLTDMCLTASVCWYPTKYTNSASSFQRHIFHRMCCYLLNLFSKIITLSLCMPLYTYVYL